MDYLFISYFFHLWGRGGGHTQVGEFFFFSFDLSLKWEDELNKNVPQPDSSFDYPRSGLKNYQISFTRSNNLLQSWLLHSETEYIRNNLGLRLRFGYTVFNYYVSTFGRGEGYLSQNGDTANEGEGRWGSLITCCHCWHWEAKGWKSQDLEHKGK